MARHSSASHFLEKCKSFFEEHKWGMLLCSVFLLWTLSTIGPLQHIPGPIFGGDLYRERGFVEHLYRGGSIFEDPTIKDEFTYFPWLGYGLAALIGVLFGVSSQTILIVLPVVMVSARLFVYYLLGKQVFKSQTLAIITTILAATFYPFDMKITANFSHFFAVLSIFFIFRYFENPNKKDAILAGVFYGLLTLSHGQAFISFSFMLLLGLVLFVLKLIFLDNFTMRAIAKKYWHVTLLYGVAILISLLFFGPLIAKYQLHMDNPVPKYSLNDATKLGFWFPWETIRGYLTPSISMDGLVTLFTLLGILFCILNLRKTEQSLALFFFIAIFLGVSHYLITMPLFDTWFEPWKVPDQYRTPVLLLTVFGFKQLLLYAPKQYAKHAAGIAIGIAALICVSMLSTTHHNFTNERWFQYGSSMDSYTRAMYDVGDWIKENTARDAVFLANDESAFALNAMSGAKVAFLRRVHASYFVGIDERYADGMVILYGNNTEKQRELLKKHDIDYLYVDQHLVSYPMIVKKEFASLLRENGVQFTEERVRFDPSTLEAAQFDALIVPPQNLTIVDVVEQVKVFTADGQPISAMYRIKME